MKTYNIKVYHEDETMKPVVKVKSRETGNITYAIKIVAHNTDAYNCLIETKIKVNLDHDRGSQLVSVVEEWISELKKVRVDEFDAVKALNDLVSALASYVCYPQVECRYKYGIGERDYLAFEATIY